MGGYQFSKTPYEPIGVHMVHVPVPDTLGLDQRTAWRTGRATLQAMTYEQFEERVVDELTRILGPHGFDAQRDIAAIAVYRWGHGYAYARNSLYDDPEPHALESASSRRKEHLTIAGSDAGWDATANCAIDQAARAVAELGV
jgi:spermidine dehydrogenase